MLIKKVGLLILLLAASITTSFSQELKFESLVDEEIDGSIDNCLELEDNGFLMYQANTYGGKVSLYTRYYDSISGILTSTKIDDLKKVNLLGFSGVKIKDQLFTLELSKSKKELFLKERNKFTLEYTGEEKLILTSEKKLADYYLISSNNYFALIDNSGYFSKNAFKAFIFNSESMQIEREINTDGKSTESLEYHSIGFTKDESFYSLSSPAKGKLLETTLENEITLDIYKNDEVKSCQYNFEGGLMHDVSLSEADNGDISILAYTYDSQIGMSTISLKLVNESLVEQDKRTVSLDEIYRAVDYPTTIEKPKSSDKVKASYENYGTSTSVNGEMFSYRSCALSFYEGSKKEKFISRVKFLQVSKVSKNGKITWSNCYKSFNPFYVAKDIVINSCPDDKGNFHFLLSDYEAFYNADNTFNKQLKRKDIGSLKTVPVHVLINVNGEIEKRYILTEGFNEGDTFSPRPAMRMLDDGVMLVGKTQYYVNVSKPVTLGKINVN
jgi:hypothetical protein